MAPKFFKSAILYPRYIREFYAARPGMAEADYATQHAALIHDSFYWGDVWKRSLEADGSWAVQEVLSNVEPLQRAWAREHAIVVPAQGWQLAILKAQLLEARPDAWFHEGFRGVVPTFRAEIRRALPGLRVLAMYDGIGWDDAAFAEGCDTVITCLDSSAAFYGAHGFRPLLIQHGFDPGILRKLARRPPTVDVGFAGSILMGRRPHSERLRVLAAVARRMPVEFHATLAPLWHLPGNRFLAMQRGEWRGMLGTTWRLTRDYFTLRRHSREALFGLAMFQSLADARISLNIHIDAAGDRAVNMRLFEATGVGSCLLTDNKPGLDKLFEVGKEIVVFDGPADCVEKALWLLEHEPERAAIARAGQARTLKDHNLEVEIRRVGAELAALLQ